MIKFKRVTFVAPVAEGRLCNLALFDEASFFLLTTVTGECGFFHLRNHVTATNDDSSQGN
jgi:hypothetical protein